MLRQLVEDIRGSDSLFEMVRLLQELAAYVMQTGPRGGRFYYTPSGKKVYRELGGKSGKARKQKKLTGEDYDQAWASADRPWMRSSYGARVQDGAEMGRRLKELFGENAPTPDELETMFDAPELGVSARPSSISIGGGSPPSMGLRYDVRDENDTRVGSMSRSISRETPDGPLRIYHNSFSVYDRNKGKGIGGAVLGKAIKAYKRLGIKKIEVSAAGGGGYNGGYTWARFGFEPNNSYAFEDGKRAVTTAMMRAGIPPAQARWIQRMRMRDLYTVAGIRVQVPTGRTLKSGRKQMKTIPVGKNVMKNRSWGGSFDMDDPVAVGRWNRQTRKAAAKRKKILARKKSRAA
jgi:GNAT superfamily N-acetyltransferase